MSEDLLFFNGINGASGDYLLPPLTQDQIGSIAQGKEFNQEDEDDIKQKLQDKKNPHLAPIEGVDPKNLST